MKRWFVVAALVLAALPAAAARQADPRGFFPLSYAIEGWARPGQLRAFTPQNLYEYIDGAADLFKAYGVEFLLTGDYLSGAGSDHKVTIDLYHMGSPLHAFGIFTSERPAGAKQLALGAQGYAESGLIAFWSGPYYVKVSEASKGDEAAAEELAKALAARMPRATGLPEELQRLPQQNRIPESEKYVRLSALGHRSLREDVSAEYALGKLTGELHVLDLGTPQRASDGWDMLWEFEAKAGSAPKKLLAVGEEALAAKDSSFGEFVVARRGRFLVMGMSEKAGRADVVGLVLRGLRTVAALPPAASPVRPAATH